MFYDIHPFLRPLQAADGVLSIRKPYGGTGPLAPEDGMATYEFTWTMGDLLNPLCANGFRLHRVAESPPCNPRFWQDYSYEGQEDQRLSDWRINPLAAIPAWLTVSAQKL